nr:immunoglobulin heavy chain junction region [Macaca mulatta]
CVRKQSNLDSW